MKQYFKIENDCLVFKPNRKAYLYIFLFTILGGSLSLYCIMSIISNNISLMNYFSIMQILGLACGLILIYGTIYFGSKNISICNNIVSVKSFGFTKQIHLNEIENITIVYRVSQYPKYLFVNKRIYCIVNGKRKLLVILDNLKWPYKTIDNRNILNEDGEIIDILNQYTGKDIDIKITHINFPR